MSEQKYAYRAMCEHGKVRWMCADHPRWAEITTAEVRYALARGLTVDRVTVEEARRSDMDCPECDKKWRKR